MSTTILAAWRNRSKPGMTAKRLDGLVALLFLQAILFSFSQTVPQKVVSGSANPLAPGSWQSFTITGTLLGAGHCPTLNRFPTTAAK
jgi:hypothetical protein